MSSSNKEYGYIAYIDEAGDPGLKRVRPIDDEGGTEWLILSAVVIRTPREPLVKGWVEDLISELGIKQRNDLHYRTLSPTRKIAAGERIATLPLRGFAVCSNKKNMRGYRNKRAEKISSQQWFYNWCIRLLLERVTAFCASRTQQDYGKVMPIKIEFSERGGIRYSQSAAYQYYLGLQQEGDKIYLKKREPVMKMLDWDLMEAHAHADRAGMQLADFVASAFFQAADILDVKERDIRPAIALKPIMAKEGTFWHDFGVALFPTPARVADLKSEQKEIFERYGYDFARW
jgi:Protein of unknown function (DUF3800)